MLLVFRPEIAVTLARIVHWYELAPRNRANGIGYLCIVPTYGQPFSGPAVSTGVVGNPTPMVRDTVGRVAAIGWNAPERTGGVKPEAKVTFTLVPLLAPTIVIPAEGVQNMKLHWPTGSMLYVACVLLPT